MKDIIIIDNQLCNFALQIHNGVPIREFHGDKNDLVLNSLCNYLMEFKSENDVRTKISRDFNLSSLISKKMANEL